jgi:hypothetical protein
MSNVKVSTDKNLESHEALVGCPEKDEHVDNVLELMLSCYVRFWMERICILCGTTCYWSYNDFVMFNLVCYSYKIVCICSVI